ncbi:U-box domain-containing protein 5 [Diplonema papillatum]|nr:U-box domain-containing protein 5 [Diplonema papillatum]
MYGRAPPASVLGFLLVVVVCAGGSNADSSDDSKTDVTLAPAQLPTTTEAPAVLKTPVPLDWRASTAAPPPPCTGRSCNRRKNGPRSMKVLLIVSLCLLALGGVCVCVVRRRAVRMKRMAAQVQEERQLAAQRLAERNKPLPPLPRLPYEDITGAPDHFYCPITQEVMHDPVVCTDGYHHFERGHIERFMDLGNECCPISRRFMKKEELRANVALKAEIDEWVAAQQKDSPSEPAADDAEIAISEGQASDRSTPPENYSTAPF